MQSGQGSVQHVRHILHVDMDAFFAAIEQRDQPELRGKPVLVGGDPKGRGVVSTASYEARRFGCHSAMPMASAVCLCPQAVIVQPDMKRYAEASRQMFEILGQFTPLVEPISIDEAFLDVTGSTRLLGPPAQIAREVKRQIRSVTDLTASVGVAANKFLAKLASDHDKPDGLVVVDPGEIQAFLDPLPITRLWGVGKATLPKLEALGVRTFGNLRRVSRDELCRRFGDSGERFHRLVRGVDHRDVIPDRDAKSISHEVTFRVDVTDRECLRSVLLGQTESVTHRLRRHGFLARTVTIKIRTFDFSTVTRSTTVARATDQTEAIWLAASGLLEHWQAGSRAAVRLIGVGVSKFSSRENEQFDLFDEVPGCRDGRQLDRAVDEIRGRFGDNAIARGRTDRRPRGD